MKDIIISEDTVITVERTIN